MANIVQFAIDDTSPTISYLPSGDTLGRPDLTAGWNPFFTGSGFAASQGVRGNGTSLHVTQRDGAQLSITWRGTNIQLQGNTTDADYTVELDGETLEITRADLARNVLATIQDLPNALHTISITARIPQDQTPQSSMVRFDQAIVASKPPNITATAPNNVYSLRSLDAGSVAFHGRWSFTDEGGVPRHQSDTTGDRVMARFKGTGFQIRGITSPKAGRFSVTLNNETVTLSAKSSFTSPDSLLYYATVLEPNVTHTVTITNEGEGTLSLMEDGFRAYAVGSPDPDPTESPAPVIALSPSPFNKGAIAALALGGILACAIICGLLYYLFIFRSRRKVEREREQWRRQLVQSAIANSQHEKRAEADDSVLDIARHSASSEMQEHERQGLHLGVGLSYAPQPGYLSAPRRQSGKSSFARWKREVETSIARDSLGIQFRHSDDTSSEGRTNTVLTESDQPSGSSGPSFVFRASRMFRKADPKKANENGQPRPPGDHRSWSPSYHINIPFKPPSPPKAAASKAPATSTMDSLSYLTAPPPSGRHELEPSESLANAPPSYAASVLTNGSSSPLSVPRSVGQNSPYPTSTNFNSLKRAQEASAKGDDAGNRTSGGHLTSIITNGGSLTSDLTPPFLIRDLSKEDRGSVDDQSMDEEPKLLGGSAVRQVLRSLSPRTSRANFLPRRSFHQGHNGRELSSSLEMDTIQSPVEQPSSPARGPPSPTAVPTVGTIALALSQRHPRPLPPTPHLPSHGTATTHEPPQLPPIRISYNTSSKHGSSPLVPKSAAIPQSSPQQSQHPTRDSSQSDPPSTSRKPFRLTPASFIPFPHQDSPPQHPSGTAFTKQHLDGVRDSFIDFTVSSDVSTVSNNGYTDASSALDVRRYSTPPQAHPPLPEERSRWSSTNTGPSIHARNEQSINTEQPAHGGNTESSPKTPPPLPSSSSSSGAGAGSNGNTPPATAGRANPPVPISIPSNAQFLNPHRSRFRVSIATATSGASSARSDPVHVHPAIESLDSPTDSIPVSATDLKFLKHSSSEVSHISPGRLPRGGGGRGTDQHAPPSSLPLISPFRAPPPSPSENTHSEQQRQRQQQEAPPTGLSSPNYIVHRVLGLHSPAPSAASAPTIQTSTSTHQLAQQPIHTANRSGSTLGFFNTPLSARFERSLRKHGSDLDISRTTS